MGAALTDSVDMRRERSQRLPLVHLDCLRAVQIGDVIVRVHSYQDVCHIRLGRIKAQLRLELPRRKRMNGIND